MIDAYQWGTAADPMHDGVKAKRRFQELHVVGGLLRIGRHGRHC
jgi:hypothetical protein